MTDYKQPYHVLFNAITDSLEALGIWMFQPLSGYWRRPRSKRKIL